MLASELLVSPSILAEVREFVETHHYSHSLNGVKITQCFTIKHGGILVGAVVFGQMSTTAWKKFGKTEEEVLELRRLCLIDEAGKNSESFCISKCLKWIKRNLPKVKCVVSYADPMHGHTRVVYKASNFEYRGITPNDSGFLHPETGKTYHSRALRTKYKGEYKPFVVKLRALLLEGKLEKITLTGKHCFT